MQLFKIIAGSSLKQEGLQGSVDLIPTKFKFKYSIHNGTL